MKESTDEREWRYRIVADSTVDEAEAPGRLLELFVEGLLAVAVLKDGGYEVNVGDVRVLLDRNGNSAITRGANGPINGITSDHKLE